MDITKSLSKKQLQILAFPNSNYDSLICDGSVRSGKTSIMSVAFVIWAMRDFDRRNFAICSKTIGTALKNVIKPLLAMTYMQKKFNITSRSGGSEITIQGFGHTNTFYCYGGQDARSYMLIQGITLAGVLLDEVALMPRSFVEQAIARCSVDGRKLWFNCNPESQYHWFYQEWILNCEAHNALHLHFVMDDNPSLSEKIKKDYESMFHGVFYDRYIRGLWVMAEGLVYDMFDKDKHVISELPELHHEYYVSTDFGIQNATVFLLWGKSKDTNDWIVCNEWYYSGTENKKLKATSELADGLDALVGDRYIKSVIIDPSASALKVELRKHGYRVREADNDVINGISDVSNLLVREKLHILKKCTHTINEFGVYAWDLKAAERGIDAPIKKHDHAMDALRYLVRTLKLVKKDKRR